MSLQQRPQILSLLQRCTKLWNILFLITLILKCWRKQLKRVRSVGTYKTSPWFLYQRSWIGLIRISRLNGCCKMTTIIKLFLIIEVKTLLHYRGNSRAKILLQRKSIYGLTCQQFFRAKSSRSIMKTTLLFTTWRIKMLSCMSYLFVSARVKLLEVQKRDGKVTLTLHSSTTSHPSTNSKLLSLIKSSKAKSQDSRFLGI